MVLTVGNLVILVGEDDPDDQLLFELAAEEAGVELSVEFVDDGVALLASLRRRLAEGALPDLVLLDLQMPIMTGYQVLDALKEEPAFDVVPRIVFSSSSRVRDREDTAGRGADWYQSKSSNFDDLVAFIASLPGRVSEWQQSHKLTPAPQS